LAFLGRNASRTTKPLTTKSSQVDTWFSAVCCHHLYMVTTFKYTDFKVYEQVILDYLREGFPWPARPCKHTESNLFKHAVTTFKYTNLYFIPPGPRGLARPPHI